MHITSYAALKPGLKVDPYRSGLSGPQTDEVLIAITHCGVGRGDVGFLENAYQIPDLKYPLVAGHEMVGTVVKCGESVTDLTVGDRVGVGYQVWSCGICEFCLQAREQLCQKQKCLVKDRQGGFASHICVNRHFVCKVPASLSSAEATPLFCSGLTVYSAIKKAHIVAGMSVGVVGIGGLGHMAVQILKVQKARITAFSKKHNEAGIRALGADEVVSTPPTALLKTFDRLFITTHASIDYDRYLRLLKPDGQLWVIGSDTNKTTFSSWILNDFAERSICGSYIGSPAEMRELLELASTASIRGKVSVLPMAELNDALQLVAKGSDSFRIVVAN
ncbi:MAG TPA: alcohol dehydrogenase catalytic domain-containing protein [Candidatus Acidoferrum sp.]|nr:alcohol dehydrogenase catalytic domain-containing protein [Candidatus Acidoferrum sp.]